MVLRSLFATLVAASAMAPEAVQACSCIPPTDAATQLAKADVLFIGKAEATTKTGRRDGEDALATKFSIQRIVKGPKADTLLVEHDGDGSSCGMTFQRGRSYVILASRYGAQLTTNMCKTPYFPIAAYERAMQKPR